MIPEVAAIVFATKTIATALGVSPRVSEPAIRAVLRETEHLAADIYDVPAALLFMFGRYPRCFAAFRAMSVLVVLWHTKTLGFRLEVGPAELAGMLRRVALDEADYEEVRSWMAQRMLPFGG